MTPNSYRRTCLCRVARWSSVCSLVACFVCHVFAYPAEAQVKTVHFDVPEGKAVDTLRKAAFQANVDIIFAGRLIRGISTPALKGDYAPQEAFSFMLAHTSLVVFQHKKSGVFAVKETKQRRNVRPADEAKRNKLESMNQKKSNVRSLSQALAVMLMGYSSLSAQESDNIFELDPFSVAASNESQIGAVESISATRFATRINELPFAVNVLTEELLQDLSVADMRDAVQFAGGVVNGGNSFGTTTSNSYRIRGFPTTQNLINGFSVSTGFNIAPNSIQRVEVVKGPASLLYGAVPPGGVVNFIPKRPTAEHRGSVKYIHGSWDFNRLDVDSSGPITDSIRYLVNLSMEDRDFYSVGNSRESLHINPQLEFDFADKRGNILIDYYHSHTDQIAINSIAPRKRATATDIYGRLADEVDENFPVPNFNIRDRGAPLWDESDSLFVKFRYWFNDNYTLRAAFRTQDNDGEAINQATVGTPIFVSNDPARPGQDIRDGTTGVAQWDTQGRFGGSDNLQVNLLMNYDFEWGNIQIMPGFDYNSQDDWFWRFRAGVPDPDTGARTGNFRSQPKNIYEPNTWVFDAPSASQYIVDDPRTPEIEGPGLLRNNEGNDGSSTDYYVYGSGSFLDDNLIVTFGYRDSSFENSLVTTEEKRIPLPSERVFDEELSGGDSIYQYGAVYKLIPDKLHLYGNFAQSFQPQLRSIKLIDSDMNPIDIDVDGDGINDLPDVNDNVRVPANHLFGEGWEVGAKGSLGENGRFSYAVAYFTTTNNNIIRNITVGPTPDAYSIWFPNLDAATIAAIAALPVGERLDEFQVQSGEEEASGYEFELTATPIDGWDIRATLTLLDAVLLADPSAPEAVGRVLPNSPKQNFNIFTRYGFSGNLEGLFIGGSADYFSERFSAAPQSGNAGLRSRPRTLVNAFVGYRMNVDDRTYRLQLNVQNLTDVFDTEGANLGAPLLPTSYRLTFGVDF